jgi:hypothetical protein
LEELAAAAPIAGDVVTLVHGGYEGTRVEWKFAIERAHSEAPFPTEAPPEDEEDGEPAE